MKVLRAIEAAIVFVVGVEIRGCIFIVLMDMVADMGDSGPLDCTGGWG